MGTTSVKDLALRFPTACHDIKEIPKTYDQFLDLLTYLKSCRECHFEHYQYCRNLDDFHMDNITQALLQLELKKRRLDYILSSYAWLAWNGTMIFNGLNTKVLPPSFVCKHPTLNWDWKTITATYWSHRYCPGVLYDINLIQECCDISHSCECYLDYRPNNLQFFDEIVKQYKHLPLRFKKSNTERHFLSCVGTLGSSLYGYAWHPDVLQRAADYMIQNTMYRHQLQPWILDWKLYQPIK